MRTFTLVAFLAIATMQLAAQGIANSSLWYCNEALFTAHAQGNTITMTGHSLNETNITFTLDSIDDGIYRLASHDNSNWAKQASATWDKLFMDQIDNTLVLSAVDGAGNTQNVLEMKPSTGGFNVSELVQGDFDDLIEGEYRDPQGRKATIMYGSLKLPGSKQAVAYCYGTLLNSKPASALITQGHGAWLWEATTSGINLYKATLSNDGTKYVAASPKPAYALTKLYGTAGRWGWGNHIIQRTQLQLLSNKCLRFARSEILALHGYIFDDPVLAKHFKAQTWYEPLTKGVHLTKIDLYNTEMIKAEEKARQQ